jgi:hypothetical protein
MNTAAMKAFVCLVAAGCALVQATQGALQWTLHPLPREGTNDVAVLTSVAFGNGKFVAISNEGETYSAPAMEPQTWTHGPSIPDVDLSTITFADGRFAAVGLDLQTTNSVFLSSADGIDWMRQRLGSDERLYDVAHGNGRFVVVGGSAVGWSTNGVDWAMEPDFVREPKPYFQSLDFVNGKFMATFFDESDGPFPSTKLAVSTDGMDWEEDAGSGSWFFKNIAYGRKIYVALHVTDCVPCGGTYVSEDGRTWEMRGIPNAVNGLAITYANGMFAVSGIGQPSSLLSSADGLNWDEFRIGRYDFLPGLTFGAGRFVAVGQGQVAVSDFVGSLPYVANYRLSAEAIEFDFDAPWKTEWQVETSENLVEWSVVKELEGAEFGPEKVNVPREGKVRQFVRVKEKR